MSMFIILILFLLGSCASNHTTAPHKTHSTTSSDAVHSISMMNIVMFFADTGPECKYEKLKGIDHLNMSFVGEVKPCSSRVEADLPIAYKSIIRSMRSSECDCKKLLSSSIMSLLGWARNALGMSTAVVSLQKPNMGDGRSMGLNFQGHNILSDNLRRTAYSKPHPMGNVLSGPKIQQPSNLQTVEDIIYLSGAQHPKTGKITSKPSSRYADQLSKYPHLEEENPLIKAKNKANMVHLPLPYDKSIHTDDLPKLEVEANPQEHNILTINAYPHEPSITFNNIHRYRHRFRPEDFANVHRVKRQLIVEPENTQVFEIDNDRMKHDPSKLWEMQFSEGQERPQSIWDLLGLMSTIRDSFFINFINPMLDPAERIADEESGIDFKSLGQIQEPSLFPLVRRMLLQLKRQSSESSNGGYILVVFGGLFLDLSDPYSDISQSIKHVLETTNRKHTLTVVTGNCPKIEKNPGNVHDSGMDKSKIYLLPVYATGLYHENLSKASELYDIPKQMQSIIKAHNSKGVATKSVTTSKVKYRSQRTHKGTNSQHQNKNHSNKPTRKVFQNFEPIEDGILPISNTSPRELWLAREIKNTIFERIRKDIHSNSMDLKFSIHIAFFVLLFNCII